MPAATAIPTAAMTPGIIAGTGWLPICSRSAPLSLRPAALRAACWVAYQWAPPRPSRLRCKQPEQVAGLVLVLPPTAWDTRPRQSAIYRRLARVSGLFGAAPYRLLDLLPIPMREDGRSQLALHTMKGLATANPLHVQAALGGAARSDMPDPALLRQLQVPTLILAWEDDVAHPVSTATELADTLPDVRGLVICQPDDISEWESALAEFVQDIAAAESVTRRPARKKRVVGKRKRGMAAA